MGIRLIAVDLDGTLLASDSATVPEENIRALRRAAEKGAEIVLASGRSLAMMRDAAAQLGCVNYAVSSLGAAVTDLRTGRQLAVQGLTPEQRRAIIAVLAPYEPLIEVYCDNRIYVEREELERRPPESDFDFLRFRYDDRVDGLDAVLGERTVEKVDADFFPDTAALEDVRVKLEAMGGLHVLTYPRHLHMEVSDAGATKSSGMQALCGYLGIAAEEVLALGDSDNDLDLFAWAGSSVAMANGSPLARQAADMVTVSNDEGGVARGVEALMDRIGNS